MGDAKTDAQSSTSGTQRPKTPPVPVGTKPCDHQVAGHMHGRGKTKIGMLQCEDGTILKPLQAPPRGDREVNFYKTVFFPECTDATLLSLRNFLPKYRGTYTSPDHPSILYLRLDDAAKKFKKACIIDLKIGTITYDPLAPPDKIAREKSKYPWLEETGYQLVGMRVYVPSKGEFDYYDKIFLRGLNAEDIWAKGLGAFFNREEGLRRDIIESILQKLRAIEHWFMTHDSLHFFASSLLLVYEGASEPLSEKQRKMDWVQEKCSDDSTHAKVPEISDSILNCAPSSDKRNQSSCAEDTQNKTTDSSQPTIDSLTEVKMIDFAHVFPADKRDDNYLFGLRGVMRHLQNLLDLKE